jgi:lipopolysaccharide/colanic/teichoic acid biosynthesis glycosyltransferase
MSTAESKDQGLDLSPGAKIWGLTPPELHTAAWRGRGVQTVHRGERFEQCEGVEIYLLLEKFQLVIFDLGKIAELLVWTSTPTTHVEILEQGRERYREELSRSETGDVLGVRRSYGYIESSIASAVFTTSEKEAKLWAAGMPLADSAKNSDLHEVQVFGHAYDARREGDEEDFLKWIIASWVDPQRVLPEVTEIQPGIFSYQGALPPEGVTLIAPFWIGCGRESTPRRVYVGPEFLLDQNEGERTYAKASIRTIREISIPGGRKGKHLMPRRLVGGVLKRVFDFSMAGLALLCLSPIFLLVSILIFFDDGFPLFFGHVRQQRGGQGFKCWKFRTMAQNSESLVAQLQSINKADGPQVFIENDPRVTRLGSVLRRLHIDELPQLWNVVRGEMSLVGPRPSPDRENQFCPAWREMRLSVRPGITGLWQVRRTRAEGEDFQEWIRYDIEYVRTASFLLDLKILVATVRNMIRTG